MAMIKYTSVQEYISTFLPDTQILLETLRKAIQQAAPEAEEVISYNMPAFKLHGMLVYYAGYDKHIGFYPTPSGIEAFRKELSVLKNAKGSVQFPLDQPLPLDLVTRIVQFRVQENRSLAALKSKKKKE